MLQQGPWGHYVECNQISQSQKDKCCRIYLHEIPGGVTFVETESKRAGARGWGKGMESWCLLGSEYSLGRWKTSRTWWWRWLHNSVNAPNAPELCSKTVKKVNCMLCVFYTIEKRKKKKRNPGLFPSRVQSANLCLLIDTVNAIIYMLGLKYCILFFVLCLSSLFLISLLLFFSLGHWNIFQISVLFILQCFWVYLFVGLFWWFFQVLRYKYVTHQSLLALSFR